MRGIVLIASLACALGGAARADDTDEARRYYSLGTRLYDEGKFKEAAEAYAKSYVTRNDPSLLFYIGQAYRLAGMSKEALHSYRSFLARQPRTPLRAEVEAHIAALEKTLTPTPTPQPQTQPQPQPTTQTQPTQPTETAASQAAPAASPAPAIASSTSDRPISKRWWVWTIAAVVVVGVAVGIGVAFGVPNNADTPAGAYTVRFP